MGKIKLRKFLAHSVQAPALSTRVMCHLFIGSACIHQESFKL